MGRIHYTRPAMTIHKNPDDIKVVMYSTMDYPPHYHLQWWVIDEARRKAGYNYILRQYNERVAGVEVDPNAKAQAEDQAEQLRKYYKNLINQGKKP